MTRTRSCQRGDCRAGSRVRPRVVARRRSDRARARGGHLHLRARWLSLHASDRRRGSAVLVARRIAVGVHVSFRAMNASTDAASPSRTRTAPTCCRWAPGLRGRGIQGTLENGGVPPIPSPSPADASTPVPTPTPKPSEFVIENISDGGENAFLEYRRTPCTVPRRVGTALQHAQSREHRHPAPGASMESMPIRVGGRPAWFRLNSTGRGSELSSRPHGARRDAMPRSSTLPTSVSEIGRSPTRSSSRCRPTSTWIPAIRGIYNAWRDISGKEMPAGNGNHQQGRDRHRLRRECRPQPGHHPCVAASRCDGRGPRRVGGDADRDPARVVGQV